MSLSYYAICFLIIFIATITPGPSMILALHHGVNFGYKRAIYSALGNSIANLIMALVSIVGLSIVLIASGKVFNIIKWFGVAYLVFIGLKMFFTSTQAENNENSQIKKNEKKNIRLFIDGFLIAAGNPKGIIFFTALLPQFIDVKNTSIIGLSIIFLTLWFIAFDCFMLYAVFGNKLNKLFQMQVFRKFFNRITGAIFIGFGLLLAFSKK